MGSKIPFFPIFVFRSLNHKIWYIILINMHLRKQDPRKWNFYSWCALLNSISKLRQVVKKFVFLFQCLISSIWLKIHFLKLCFVLKKSPTFHEIFLPKVLLSAVFKNSKSKHASNFLRSIRSWNCELAIWSLSEILKKSQSLE